MHLVATEGRWSPRGSRPGALSRSVGVVFEKESQWSLRWQWPKTSQMEMLITRGKRSRIERRLQK